MNSELLQGFRLRGWRVEPLKGEVTGGLGDGFRLLDRTGVRVNPLDRSFHFSRYMWVNYMMVLKKVVA